MRDHIPEMKNTIPSKRKNNLGFFISVLFSGLLVFSLLFSSPFLISGASAARIVPLPSPDPSPDPFSDMSAVISELNDHSGIPLSDETIYAREGVLYDIGQNYSFLIKGSVQDRVTKIWIELYYMPQTGRRVTIDSFVLKENESFVCSRLVTIGSGKDDPENGDPSGPHEADGADTATAPADAQTGHEAAVFSFPVIATSYSRTYLHDESSLIEFSPFTVFRDPVRECGLDDSDMNMNWSVEHRHENDSTGNLPDPGTDDGNVPSATGNENDPPGTDDADSPSASDDGHIPSASDDGSSPSVTDDPENRPSRSPGPAGTGISDPFGDPENIIPGIPAALILSGIFAAAGIIYFRNRRA